MIPVTIVETRVEGARMIATVRLPDGSLDEFSGEPPAGWSVGFLVEGSEQVSDITTYANAARSAADDMASRPARLPFISIGQTFDTSQYVGTPATVVLGLSHLHDWRERCNACPVCDLHDGFHDEARHAARVTIPAHCLIRASARRPQWIPRDPEEIEAVRRARASQREGTS